MFQGFLLSKRLRCTKLKKFREFFYYIDFTGSDRVFPHISDDFTLNRAPIHRKFRPVSVS